MRELNLARPLGMYHNGDDFKGQVFALFPDADTVGKIVREIEKKKPQVLGKSIWCKPDRQSSLAYHYHYYLVYDGSS